MARIVEVEWIHFKTIDSTNAWVKAHANELDPNKLTCVLAKKQTAAYGRQKRQWVSEEGNLHMSLFFLLPPDDPVIPNLAQILSFSCAKILPENTQIKWPNDLLIDGKKICGVLVEAVSIGEQLGVIMGLGINVHIAPETDQETIALCGVTQESCDLDQLAQVIVFQFLIALKRGFATIKREYDARLAYKGERISCIVNGKQIKGTLIGIDDQGHLKITTSDGEMKTFTSGDIHHLRNI